MVSRDSVKHGPDRHHRAFQIHRCSGAIALVLASL
jgi:hypothetical protein